jgi:hypothetical protein
VQVSWAVVKVEFTELAWMDGGHTVICDILSCLAVSAAVDGQQHSFWLVVCAPVLFLGDFNELRPVKKHSCQKT